jgi:hypothetical protein
LNRLGHSTMAMTERYSHLSPENSRGTVKTIEKVLDGRREGNGQVEPVVARGES